MNMNVIIEKCSGEQLLTRGVLISEIALLIYGIFLLIFPTKALNLSVGFIGVLMILCGVFCGAWFVLHRDDGNYPLIALAGIGIIVGILVMFFRSAIALILFPVLLGIWVLLSTVLAAFAALGNYRMGNGLWWIPFLAAIVGAVVTVLIFINLSGTERFMARILGIYFITYNVVRLGEFGALHLSPAPSNRRRSSGHRSGSSRQKRVYEENINEEPIQEYDVYGYRDTYDDDNYRRYREERNRGYDRYDDYDRDRY